MDETLFFICPCCGSRLEIDKKNGEIINIWEKPDTEQAGDPMKSSLKKIEEKQKELQSYFSKAGEKLKNREKELNDLFEKNKKSAAADKDGEKPVNPMDLD